MKKFLLLFLSSCLILSSCQDEKSGDGVYYNDFETMGYWSDSPLIKTGVSKSGQFCIYNDSLTEYSNAFKIRLGDIKVPNPRKVTATAWVMSNDVNAMATFVVNLDSAGKSVAWNGTKTQSVIIAPGKWFEITSTIDLPEKFSPDEKLYMFGWYGGKGTVYFDDFLLKVE